MLNAIGSSLAPTQIQSTRRICSKGCAKQAGRKADFCLSTIVHVWMMRQHTAQVTLGRQPAAALWGSRDAFSNPRDLVSRTVHETRSRHLLRSTVLSRPRCSATKLGFFEHLFPISSATQTDGDLACRWHSVSLSHWSCACGQDPKLSLAPGSREHSRQVARSDGKLPDANAKRRKRILNRRSDSGRDRQDARLTDSFDAKRVEPRR